MAVLIVGVGNRQRRDDGAGPCVVERLAGRVGPDVRLLSDVADPLRLLDAWTSADRVDVNRSREYATCLAFVDVNADSRALLAPASDRPTSTSD